jgi:hypothetical protein
VNASAMPPLAVRPYQLLCIVCRIGAGRGDDLGDDRLAAILSAVRDDPLRPVTLRCNADSCYRYQNPGRDEDTPEGALFNEKRDLDILQRMGLVPGDTRPAIEVFERLLATVTETMGICAYPRETSPAWRGCAAARSSNYERGREMGLAAVIPGRSAEEMGAEKQASATRIYEADRLLIRPHHLMCMTCFHGGREELAPIAADNLFEAIDVIHKRPEIPITLVRGCCMICPPCSLYDPGTGLCRAGMGMNLRDQKKDLDVLQKLGLEYGDTVPARELLELLYERIPSTRDVCGYGDGKERAWEWRICGEPEGREAYARGRAAKLGLS